MSTTTAPHKLYFGYGSNLWLDQMSRRCPSSPYLGIGRLRQHKWFINSRGYANIAHVPTPSPPSEVWGLIYALTPQDEDMLDINEGVPYAYEKRELTIEFWERDGDKQRKGEEREALVYIDFERDKGGFKPREEYIVRMNRGIDDALREGVPSSYVEGVLRGYIPAEEQDEEVEKLAERQAGGFKDESGVIPARVTAEAVGSGVDLVSNVKAVGEVLDGKEYMSGASSSKSRYAFRLRHQTPYLSWYQHSTQATHVYEMLNYLPKNTLQILEIGCGMGAVTDCLAQHIKSRNGHIDALDPAPDSYVCSLERYVQDTENFYPSPWTLGDHQHAVSQRNPNTVTFHNADAIKFLDDGDDKDKKWDVAVFFHSVWYLDSVDVLKNTLEKLKGRVKRVFVVEHALRATNKYARSHVFAALAMAAVGEERQKKGVDTTGHVTFLGTPPKIKKAMEETGWALEKEAEMVPDGELIDGVVDVTWARSTQFREQFNELGLQSTKKEGLVQALLNAATQELVLDDRRRMSRCGDDTIPHACAMDVWVANFVLEKEEEK
ncbi:hypothetical protein QC762_0015010 [Podospora pseudocomata]|uniref:gamma-glutamylcyclotransferase n=1 Tax=Podospora pseudocomata TaxID=2093779 RepID=A0ABR0GWG2_9PEZI|nr:hypothetical protein QC762_0015010 [Podospora pseudocomata]